MLIGLSLLQIFYDPKTDSVGLLLKESMYLLRQAAVFFL